MYHVKTPWGVKEIVRHAIVKGYLKRMSNRCAGVVETNMSRKEELEKRAKMGV